MRFGLAMAVACLTAGSSSTPSFSPPNIDPPRRDTAPNAVERRGFAYSGSPVSARELVAMRRKNARRKRR